VKEQFIYFWVLWLLVIIVFFFIENRSLRTISLGSIFLLIICTDVTITLEPFIIYVNILILIAYALFFYGRITRSIYPLLCTFICAIFYSGIRLWEKTTPVVFIFPSYILIPLIVTLILSFLSASFSERLAIALVSVTKGYMIYTFILFSYHIHHEFGELTLFIHLAVVVLLLLAVNLVKRFISYVRYVYAKFTTEHSL